jgi:hypothetical protein
VALSEPSIYPPPAPLDPVMSECLTQDVNAAWPGLCSVATSHRPCNALLNVGARGGWLGSTKAQEGREDKQGRQSLRVAPPSTSRAPTFLSSTSRVRAHTKCPSHPYIRPHVPLLASFTRPICLLHRPH